MLSAVCSSEPRSVRLVGAIDGGIVWSGPAWIDLRTALRASAPGRSSANSVRARMQPGMWNAAGWTEVMDVFGKHLSYMPTRDGSNRLVRDRQERCGRRILTFADVFSNSYEAPGLNGLGQLMVKLDGGKERSLQQLLLRWYGVVDGVDTGTVVGPDGTGDDDGPDDEVDRPEALPTRRLLAAPPTDADKRRIQRVLEQVENAMTTELFLSGRRPDLLAADLKIAAVLLRTGLREGWVDDASFFRTTHRIWTALFFAGSPEVNRGWLEYRLHQADDSAAFVSALRSPELSAALLGWAFAVTPAASTAASACFHLVVALAVARLPWLWDAGDDAAVAKELELLIAHTGLSGVTASTVRAAWERTLRRGHALLRLEEAAKGIPLPTLRSRIRAAELVEGELLWQGTAGYCVVTRFTPRAKGQKAPVLRLQNRSEESQFAAPFTMPIKSLLDEEVIPRSPSFDVEPRRVLKEFLEEMRSSLVAAAGGPASKAAGEGSRTAAG